MLVIRANNSGGYDFIGTDNYFNPFATNFDLGSVSMRVQDAGTDDERFWYEGIFDTQRVEFDDLDEFRDEWLFAHGYREYYENNIVVPTDIY